MQLFTHATMYLFTVVSDGLVLCKHTHTHTRIHTHIFVYTYIHTYATMDLFTVVSDGLVLCKLINKGQSGVIFEKAINFKIKTVHHKVEKFDFFPPKGLSTSKI